LRAAQRTLDAGDRDLGSINDFAHDTLCVSRFSRPIRRLSPSGKTKFPCRP
jgi:hypothetical protein